MGYILENRGFATMSGEAKLREVYGNFSHRRDLAATDQLILTRFDKGGEEPILHINGPGGALDLVAPKGQGIRQDGNAHLAIMGTQRGGGSSAGLIPLKGSSRGGHAKVRTSCLNEID